MGTTCGKIAIERPSLGFSRRIAFHSNAAFLTRSGVLGMSRIDCFRDISARRTRALGFGPPYQTRSGQSSLVRNPPARDLVESMVRYHLGIQSKTTYQGTG